MEVGTLININEQLLKLKFITDYNTSRDVLTFNSKFHYEEKFLQRYFLKGKNACDWLKIQQFEKNHYKVLLGGVFWN
jgi:hypothetical protein